jgi:hypothetical protein
MKVIILLASVLGVVTNAQSLSMMISLPTIELGSMSMEGIEFGAFATAAKSTKGPAAKATKGPAAAKAKAGKGTKGPAAASHTTSKPTTVCSQVGEICSTSGDCCGFGSGYFCLGDGVGSDGVIGQCGYGPTK